MTLWTPSKYTPPLAGNEDLANSGGHWLIEFVEKYVRLESGALVTLADYEKSILLRALETYPPDWPVEHLRGKLRYRTFLLSVARRNHKTSLASYIALYALLRHAKGASAYLVAPRVEQAQTAYKYVYNAVQQSPALAKRIKPSKSRGVYLRKGTGFVRILTGDSDALQGHGFVSGLWILDEAHLMKPDVYEAATASMRSVSDGMVLVLSTAGDADSELYKTLYARADKAIAGDNERFGAVILEGDSEAALDDVKSIKAANPAIDAGYFDLDIALDEARNGQESAIRRYLHNVQQEHKTDPWVPIEHWAACKGAGVTEARDLVYAIDVSPSMRHGSVAIARRNGEVIETQLVATLNDPDVDQLERIALRLIKENGRGPFAMDTYLLEPLAKRLRARGYEVWGFRQAENVRSAQFVYSHVKRHLVSHKDDEAVYRQTRSAGTKNVGDGFRLVRGTEDIDSLMATVYAIYLASIYKKKGLGIG